MDLETRDRLSNLARNLYSDFPNSEKFAKAVEARLDEASVDPGFAADRRQILFNLHEMAKIQVHLKHRSKPNHLWPVSENMQAMADVRLEKFQEILTVIADQRMLGPKTTDEVVAFLGDLCNGVSRHQDHTVDRPGLLDGFKKIWRSPEGVTPLVS